MSASLSHSSVSADIGARAARVKLLMMDCDGVLTNGMVFFVGGPDGKIMETKGFNSHDGLGFHLCHHVGLPCGIISGRESQALVEQAARLHIAYVRQGFLDKEGPYKEILSAAEVTPEQTAYIGDDLTDIPVMKMSGLAVAVANARLPVKSAAHYVTSASGGNGAVREVIEIILQAQGLWDKIVKKYGLNLAL